IVKSTDGGDTWSPVNAGLSDTDVRALVIDPIISNTLYAGTSGGGVFKSTDRASSWSAANIGLRAIGVTAVVIDPIKPGTLYADSSQGILKSTDGGTNWGRSNFPGVPLFDLATPTNLYAGAPTFGVFKSTNGGSTWDAANAGLPPSPNPV